MIIGGDTMMEKFELQAMKKLLDERHQAGITHLYMIDDMMSEILILDNPEAMREIALFVKELVKEAEEVI